MIDVFDDIEEVIDYEEVLTYSYNIFIFKGMPFSIVVVSDKLAIVLFFFSGIPFLI